MKNFLNVYLLPGLIFQGVVIGGGYATGREIAEFFLPLGAYGGLLGLLVSATVFGIVMSISFEIVRVTKKFDYQSFFHELIGPFGAIYEVLLVILMLLVLSVLSSASFSLWESIFNWPSSLCLMILPFCISMLVIFNNENLSKILGIFSLCLYFCFLILLVWSISLNDGVDFSYESDLFNLKWIGNGISYAGYNLAVIPAIFFSLIHIKERKQALVSGMLAGFIGVFPAVFLFIAMLSLYPEILNAELPTLLLLEKINNSYFSSIFQLVLFATFVQTGVGFIHAINERIDTALTFKSIKFIKIHRVIIALICLFSAVIMAENFGIIVLISKGYTALSYGFILFFLIPVVTLGVRKIFFNPKFYSH